ncbi:uncharacterized protein LOC134842891 isoform X2 [Symsagittifera roscoffensis]|uniref:uncharacterized protein LOC134842891 isoform X2 n=1 Tax=Symsagittifera roscoffensis TaxID=84072 RepID=UPI00307B4270
MRLHHFPFLAQLMFLWWGSNSPDRLWVKKGGGFMGYAVRALKGKLEYTSADKSEFKLQFRRRRVKGFLDSKKYWPKLILYERDVYAVFYGCSHGSDAEYMWVYSREPTLPYNNLLIINNELKRMGIHMYFVHMIDQFNCI